MRTLPRPLRRPWRSTLSAVTDLPRAWGRILLLLAASTTCPGEWYLDGHSELPPNSVSGYILSILIPSRTCVCPLLSILYYIIQIYTITLRCLSTWDNSAPPSGDTTTLLVIISMRASWPGRDSNSCTTKDQSWDWIK